MRSTDLVIVYQESVIVFFSMHFYLYTKTNLLSAQRIFLADNRVTVIPNSFIVRDYFL